MLRVVHDPDELQLDATAVGEPVMGAGLELDVLYRLAGRQTIAVALEGERRAYLQAAGTRDLGWRHSCQERSVSFARIRGTLAGGRIQFRQDRRERGGSCELEAAIPQ